MITAEERRQQILITLSNYREVRMSVLMREFGVSRNTIRRDIEVISCSAPIFTVQGNGGGIHVADGWYLSRQYLTEKQEALLHKLCDNLIDDDFDVMQSILLSLSLNKTSKTRELLPVHKK